MQYGTEDQKKTLLPRMMRADDIWCQGMSEPEAGDPIWPRCAPKRSETVLIVEPSSSTDRRSGRRSGTVPTGASCMCAPTPMPQTQGDLLPDRRHEAAGHGGPSLVTLNGDADFAEVFFDDARVPADALLGPLNGGWGVATTTLSHERAGAARLYAEMQVRLEKLVDDFAAADALDDPVILKRLGEIALRIKYLEVLCRRSISAMLHGGSKAPRSDRPASLRRCGVRSARTRPPLPSTCSAPEAQRPPGRTTASRRAH